MSKEIKNIINVVLAAIPLAMGIAVVVLTIINADVSTNDLIRMLGFAAVSLGILALNKNNKGEKNNGKEFNVVQYFWQITYAHTIAYFIAGIFAVVVVNYKELYSTDVISLIMLPVNTPIVALGPFFANISWNNNRLNTVAFTEDLFEEKNGLLKLGLVIIGLSLLSTIGPTMGSFDGYIYTKIPYLYQILGYPEAILYVLLFIGILHISIKYSHKKIIPILSIVFMALISFMCIMGFITA